MFLQRGAYLLFYKAGKQSGYGYLLFFKAGKQSGYAPRCKNTLSKKSNYLVSTKPPKNISATRPRDI